MQHETVCRYPFSRVRISHCTGLNAGMSLQALMALMGHYAGDPVKGGTCVRHGDGSGRLFVEAGEQSVEDLLSPDLSLVGGIVPLALQCRAELDRGLKERARLA